MQRNGLLTHHRGCLHHFFRSLKFALGVDDLCAAFALGFAIAIFPLGPLYAAAKAVQAYANELKTARTTAGKVQEMITFEDFNRLIGLPEYNQLEERYRA